MKTLVTGCLAAAVAVASSSAAQAQTAPDKVKVALARSVSNGAMLIAIKKGFFKEENIDLELSAIDTASDALTLVAQNQIQIVGAGVSAGYFNAVDRGLPVTITISRVAGGGRDHWIHQLMARELADPTEALDLITEQVIRPRLAYLGDIVAQMLARPAGDEGVLACVLSIQSQCHAAMPSPIARRLFPVGPTGPKALDRLADHIADFSLGGIRATSRTDGVHAVQKVRKG